MVIVCWMLFGSWRGVWWCWVLLVGVGCIVAWVQMFIWRSEVMVGYGSMVRLAMWSYLLVVGLCLCSSASWRW